MSLKLKCIGYFTTASHASVFRRVPPKTSSRTDNRPILRVSQSILPQGAVKIVLTRTTVLAALLSSLSFVTYAQPQASKPNFVFILMDNLGYGEVGVYGGGVTRGAPTPRIDQLANEGIRLTNFNVEAQCTPSRSAIMTGRFSIRSGTHSVPIGAGLDGLTQWEVTIAEVLSSAGYATGHFGKWHLGSAQGRLPNVQGFDE
jgi:Sulfatase